MTSSLDLAGRVALVTGGASGIGLGISTALLRRGATVLMGDIRRDHMEQVAQRRSPLTAIGSG
jgi:NAD(P)-dependent dehydrogenase (short-subunit alcohol dehydrogenase family)